MANDYSADPWVLDTAANVLLVTGRIYLDRIRWIDPSTADHKLVLVDKNDKIVVSMTCELANKDQEVRFGQWVENGLKLTVLGSGVVHLYRTKSTRN